jgi:pSer/pThr/pTyr-binding forkhead associated (FHA) protein
VIGRSNANDMVILDKEVSRRHALIDQIGGIYVIEDLNSKNGILVNRKRRSRALLRSGDIITFGQIDVTFHADSETREDEEHGAEDDASNIATIARDTPDEPEDEGTGSNKIEGQKLA